MTQPDATNGDEFDHMKAQKDAILRGQSATPGAYNWIKEASTLLRYFYAFHRPGDMPKEFEGGQMKERMEQTDALLSGVPCPPQDLGFNSPADRYAKAWHALNGAVPSETRPRGAYAPFTEREIELVRAVLDDGTYTKQEESDIGKLCDMAINCLHYANEIHRLRDQAEFPAAPSAIGAPAGEYPLTCWRSPKVKPPHLPGEHHSEDVLLCMKPRGWPDGSPIKIGHVSCGHWRPNGGNGNFDDDVAGWMPLPEAPLA